MNTKLVGLLSARLVAPATSFLVTVWVARWWGRELLGEYNLVWTFLVLFQYVSMLGVTEYTTRELGYGKERTSQCLSHGLFLITLSSSACTVVMIGCAVLIKLPLVVRYCMVTASLALPFTACSLFCQAVFTALHKIKFIAITNIIENGTFLAWASTVIARHWGLSRLLVGLVVARFLGALVSLLLVVLRIGFPQRRWEWPAFRQMFSAVCVFGITGIAFQVYMRADVILLGRLKDMATVGLYSCSSKLVEVGTMLPLTFYLFNLSVAASAYHRGRDSANREMQHLAAHFLPGLFGLLGIGLFFAPAVLSLIYGSQFSAAATILRVLLFVFVLHGVQLMLELCCQAAGYQKIAMYIALCRAGADITLNILLIPVLGAMGSALASLVATLGSLSAFRYVAKEKLEGMTLDRVLGQCVGVCLACTLLLFASAPYLGRSLAALVFSGTYLALTLKFARTSSVRINRVASRMRSICE